jgi:hypothetical protein
MVTAHLAHALVEIADTLGDHFDTSVYLHTLTDRSVQLMDITAAGVLLADDDCALRRSAASSRKALLLQQFQVQTEQGPGVDCFRTGEASAPKPCRRTIAGHTSPSPPPTRDSPPYTPSPCAAVPRRSVR